MATTEETPSITLTAEQVKQWEQWQKGKAPENSTNTLVTATTAGHFGNFANYAHMGEGTQAQALASSYRHHIKWVIDSRASKHVTGMSDSFKIYAPYTHFESVQIADGASQLIHGVGSIEYTSSISLSSVLHVPSFPVHLLSVSSIIDQFKCIVIFDENLCIFQEKGTERRIETRIRRWFINQDESALTAAVEGDVREVLLLHCRLGHIPFESLSRLYPDVFKGGGQE